MRVRAVLLAVVGLHLLALVAWGDAAPIYDESGYLRAGEEVARWLRCTAGVWSGPLCAEATVSALGRLAWHNPGYAALFPLAALLPGSAAVWIRLLQVGAGLAAGAATGAVLRRVTSDRVALLGAAVVWLHPVQIFYRLTLWPVALATLGVALFTLGVVRLAEQRSSAARGWQLGGTLLVLVFVWPQALALVPFVGLWTLRLGAPTSGRVLGPLAVVWLPWVLALSVLLGRPTAMDLASAENAALGNNPFIATGRGSSLHDPEAMEQVTFEAGVGCPQNDALALLRCRAQRYDGIARTTITADPGAALARAGLRLSETWRPDDFVARHLADRRVFDSPSPAWSALVRGLVGAAEVAVLLAAALAALVALRDRRIEALMLAVLVTTAPVLLTVGLTRLRQPMLPWIVIAALLAVGHLRRRAYTPPP